jgi:hypothetical protein
MFGTYYEAEFNVRDKQENITYYAKNILQSLVFCVDKGCFPKTLQCISCPYKKYKFFQFSVKKI